MQLAFGSFFGSFLFDIALAFAELFINTCDGHLIERDENTFGNSNGNGLL